MLQSAKGALLVAAMLCLSVMDSVAATHACYTSTRVSCAYLHRKKGTKIKHHLHQRRVAHSTRDHSTRYYTYSSAPESDRFGYGSGSATGQGIRPFLNSPPQPSNIYPSGPPVMAAPVYNFYGPTNNFFGPIYNYGQVGNVQNQANPDLNRRLDPWHGYNRNNGLENGY